MGMGVTGREASSATASTVSQTQVETARSSAAYMEVVGEVILSTTTSGSSTRQEAHVAAVTKATSTLQQEEAFLLEDPDEEDPLVTPA
jgi:hypothetical protein